MIANAHSVDRRSLTNAVLILSLMVLQLLVPVSMSRAEYQEDRVLDAQGRDLSDPDYHVIRALEDQENRGIELYRNGKYEAAYEALTEPARHGLKRAQHSIALMHILGQSVKKNLLVGTALFGLAAESGDRKLGREYAKLLKTIPEKYQSVVSDQTDYYIQRYGMEAQGIKCSRVTQHGSHLLTMKCLKQAGTYKEYPWKP